jgi:hypothetical protein
LYNLPGGILSRLSRRDAVPITRDFMTEVERAACVKTASGNPNDTG